MTNSARCRQIATAKLPGLLLATCLIVVSLNALVAPAGARGASRRTAHASLVARAPEHLAVVGDELEWSSVAGVSSYVLRQRFDGHRIRRVLAATAVGLKPIRGTTVIYSVRTDVRGSAWSSPIVIVYSASGAISRIRGESSEPGGSGIGSGSGSAPEPGAGGETGSGGQGSGTSGGAGGGGSVSESESGSSPGGGSESESESPGGGGPGVESESPGGSGSGGDETHGAAGLKVGLVGGIYGWGPTASETIRKTTGVRYTKLTIGSEGWGTVEEMVRDGVSPLILYNPGMAGMSPAAVAAGVKGYVSHMHELGLTEIELGNEVYYNGSTAWAYAAQYRAAHEALAGSGITLIADAWTDTPKPNGEWSQWETGGGWCVMFVQALGYVPDAWSFHPYGAMSADGFGSYGEWATGWATVPRMIQYMKADHVYAPLNITEVGQPTWEGTDGNTPVSEAEQAQDVKQYIDQAAEWGLASIYLYEGIDTGEGGYGLYKWPLQAKPAAGAFAEARAQVEGKSSGDAKSKGDAHEARVATSAARSKHSR